MAANEIRKRNELSLKQTYKLTKLSVERKRLKKQIYLKKQRYHLNDLTGL